MFYKTDLENYSAQAQSVDDYIDAFEKMCRHRSSVVDDFLFVECSNEVFGSKKEFCISLVRQYKDNVFSETDTQTRLELFFPEQKITFKNRKALKQHFTSDHANGSFTLFFEKLRRSALLEYIRQNKLELLRAVISEEEV